MHHNIEYIRRDKKCDDGAGLNDVDSETLPSGGSVLITGGGNPRLGLGGDMRYMCRLGSPPNCCILRPHPSYMYFVRYTLVIFFPRIKIGACLIVLARVDIDLVLRSQWGVEHGLQDHQTTPSLARPAPTCACCTWYVIP